MLQSKGEIYDQQTVKVMERLLGRGSVCVDGGAHRGDLLRHMLRLAPGAIHQAVEPLPNFARELRRNYPSVVVHECALAEVAGIVEFNHVENDPGYSGLRIRRYDRPDPVVKTLQVQAQRMDDLLCSSGPVSFIKLDLEGGEYHALLGAREILKQHRPLVVFEFGLGAADFYGVTPEMLWTYLAGELSYTITTMDRWLRGASAFNCQEFTRAYVCCQDFYFLACDSS